MPDNLPVRFDPPHRHGPPQAGDVDLVAAFLGGRRPTTLRAYGKDLADFAAFLGVPDSRAAVDSLVGGTVGRANTLALGYRTHLTGRQLAPATVARRLAALRSVVKLARTLGRVAWTIDIQSPKAEAYRDTRGPGRDGWKAMLSEARDRSHTRGGRRDLALIRLLHDNGLRRSEAVGLDLADVDLDARTVAIVGKGKGDKSLITINDQTAAALEGWIAARGSWPGPLFVRLDRAAGPGQPARLDADYVAEVTHGLGRRAGLGRGTNPHGLRHEGITRALDLAGGDVRKVRKFSRHAKVETLLRYDDNRADEAGRLARMLGDDAD